MRKSRMKPAEIETVLSMAQQGYTFHDIAEAVNSNYEAIRAFLVKRNIHSPVKSRFDDDYGMPCFKMKGNPNWDFSGDNLNLQYR